MLSAGYVAFANYTAKESEDTSDSYEEESLITGQMLKYHTVQELADYFNVSVDALVEKLRERDIECTPETKLAEIEYKYEMDRGELKAMLEEIINELRG
ncbi:hypothetical protein [Pyrococcus kukulkanii]|uniref:Uncharacterized protein n=2 Tax=Pyrococcus kukulkanii TaxID=1609559 RepID=A0ABV4T785_9EURY